MLQDLVPELRVSLVWVRGAPIVWTAPGPAREESCESENHPGRYGTESRSTSKLSSRLYY
eukprot:SAG22_NODE_909_length_6550_cov_4.656332_5_plen_60_part_00